MSKWRSRVGVLAVAIALLTSGSLAPLLEAVQHLQRPVAAHAHQTHWEDAAGTDHADRCTLGAPLAATGWCTDRRPLVLTSLEVADGWVGTSGILAHRVSHRLPPTRAPPGFAA